jgi:O-methyltransferase
MKAKTAQHGNGPLRQLQLLVARLGINISFIHPEKQAFEHILRIRRETEMVLTLNEAAQIFNAVVNTTKIPGDITEIGVYRGGSSKLICEAKGNRYFHLFDTFEGLPNTSSKDTQLFRKNQYQGSLECVQKLLQGFPNLYFYKGLFPATAISITQKMFSFVHMDVDLYESTKSCLDFFYPRMSRGGVIISHDYLGSIGVKTAFDEYFKDKPEPVLEVTDSQCLIVKC